MIALKVLARGLGLAQVLVARRVCSRGLGLLAIPGLGPVVAAGWLAATAVGAAAGAATGGIVGALTQAGVSKEDAPLYAEGVRRGGTLVSARVPDADRTRLDAILSTSAVNLQARSAAWQKSGWKTSNPPVNPTGLMKFVKSASFTGVCDKLIRDGSLQFPQRPSSRALLRNQDRA